MRARQSGMSLIEVLVGIAIGLIGILIITEAYLTNDRFNRSTLGESGAQTNGMVALYTLEREIRLSGYGLNTSGALGCGNIYWYYNGQYSSNVTGGTLPNITLAPVVITVSATPSVPDQITVMYATSGDRMFPTSISSFNASSSEVNVDGTDGFDINDLVLLVGPTGCTMAKVTQVQGSAQKLQFNPGSNGEQNPPAWGSFPTTYNAGDSILNLGNPIVRIYQVSSNKTLQVTEGYFQSTSTTTQDLVDGIVDMRALYGKDTNGDGTVDTYDNTTPTTSTGWLQVVAVKIGVLARIGNYEKPSNGGTNCDATTTAPTWSGGSFPAIDVSTVTSQDRCYRYRVFETTVPLRNMIWRP